MPFQSLADKLQMGINNILNSPPTIIPSHMWLLQHPLQQGAQKNDLL